ncbi:hypothetical protein P167DRAFT_59933 [Morchella conica CCBAS932]|uniref:Peptidase C14 n=1 Tax=Morchella conica CCBAS932 TaxID=1392247 RepID=A0A3N4KVV4_9PEZI|nr:hypothetical protein P167DRAFT_59933 [Morchella conica CCBAS932]
MRAPPAKWISPATYLLSPKETPRRKNRTANRLINSCKKLTKEWFAHKKISPENIPNARPNRKCKEYLNCFVLLLVWEKDNIVGASKEAESLKKELEERWGFWGDIYRIPFIEEKGRQQAVVEKAVELFIENRDSKSNLLLVHYGGHGGMNDSNEYVLQQHNDGRPHEVKLKPIRERLRECEADVGMVLDACYSEAGVFRSFEPHTVEILAACSAECKTAGVSLESFTNGILRVLRYQNEALNIYELSEELQRLAYPTLGTQPKHLLKLSVWGSIKLRPGVGGPIRYPNINSLFSC